MRIEEKIKSQRDKLDVEQTPPEIWTKIRNEWKEDKRPGSSFNAWKVAAIVFISTSLVLLVYTLSLQSKVDNLASLGDISNEYKEIEDRYITEIKSLEASVRLEDVSDESDFNWILEEMKTLDEINELYRKDIGKVADQTQLIGALMDYYEKKIKLLRKLELEMNRTNKFEKNEKDNTDNISI